ncbi:MAG TPA: sigma factor-like helix-turn-helix DNA-binding protein, partial [Acidimicrobiales bacterium]
AVKAMDCDQVVELAPELALDIVCGAERAAALAHLDTCGSCQHVVSSLTGVTDQLLLFLAPSVVPPPGFERQVLAPLTPPVVAPAARRHGRRWRPAVWIGGFAAAVRSLPSEQRDTLVAAAFQGLTAREISDAWGVPLGTVKTRLRLAMNKLRDTLTEAMP